MRAELSAAQSALAPIRNSANERLQKAQSLADTANGTLSIAQAAYEALPQIATENERKAAYGVVKAAIAKVNAEILNVEQVKLKNDESRQAAERVMEDANKKIVDSQKEDEEARKKVGLVNNESAFNRSTKLKEIAKVKEVIATYNAVKSDGIVLAPTDGTVLTVPAIGAKSTGNPLFTIADGTVKYHAIAITSPKDAEKLTVGATVKVIKTQNAFSEEEDIQATLRALTETNESVRATFDLPGKWDLGGTVKIQVVEEKTASNLCLLVSAIHQDSGNFFVYVLSTSNSVLGEQTIARRVSVDLVAQNNELAALKDTSVRPGDRVVAWSSKPLSNGDTVRERTV